MADPYQQQHGYPPAPWPQAQPAYQPPAQPPKRKSRTPLIVSLSILSALALVIVVTVTFGVLNDRNKPAGSDAPPAGSPTPNPSLARPGVDVGAGTPGAPCATNRQGYFFVKDGVTYTCKGPAPYRWQP